MDQQVDAVCIDGQLYTFDDLTFAEQREARDAARRLAPDGDPDEAGVMDVLPAFVWVVRKRTEPDYTLEQALDLKPSDLEPPAPKAEGAKRPPRKRAA